jgi:hypothetical protein
MRRIKTFGELFEGATKKDKEEFPTLEVLENLPVYKKAKKFLGDATVGSSLGVRKFSFGTSYPCYLKPSGNGNANLVYGSIMIEKDMPFSTPAEMNDAMTMLILYSIAQIVKVLKVSYSASKSAVFGGDSDELNSVIRRILNKISKETSRTSSKYDSRGYAKGSSGILDINDQFRQLEFIMSLPGVKSGINTEIKTNSDLADDLVRIAIKLDNLDGILLLSDLGIVKGKNVNDVLDDHFKRNQEDLYLLDDHPDIKNAVLKRTDVKDLSGPGRESNRVKWLNECTNGTWETNPKTGLVDVTGTFRCGKSGIRNFQGVKFGHVTGDFDCSNNKITSLEGAPQTVDGGFNCDYNNLESLLGSPQKVDTFNCTHNNLKSLEGAPQIVNKFYCNNNNLLSLTGGPQRVGQRFECSQNNLKSLKGGPVIVWGDYICTNNQLTSLEGAPMEVGSFICDHNNLESLRGAPRTTVSAFTCAYNKLKTLEGGPETVGAGFQCYNNNLESLNGAPSEIAGNFICTDNNLKSMEGSPKKLGGYFSFTMNNKQYVTEKDKWNFDGWINFVKKNLETFAFFKPIIGDDALDKYFKDNPLELHMLNPYPDIKSGVLKRTGMKDYSKLGGLLKIGLV